MKKALSLMGVIVFLLLLTQFNSCKKDEKLHFDIQQYRTIFWEREKPDAFKKELRDCIEANIGKGKNKPK